MRGDNLCAARSKSGRAGEEGELAMPPKTLTTLKTWGAVAAMLLASAVVLAQGAAPQTGKPAVPGAPATTPGGAGQPAQPAPAAAGAPAPEPYTYNPDGRRDPFVSLIARGVEAPAAGVKSTGLGGITTAELVVKGVLNSKGSYIALVAGPDGKTYTAHVNDRLVDGTIRSITPQGLVVVQEVNDPLSLIKQREVRKGLRASEDGK
jgi:type IV pilus assembly protein PilP